MFTMISAFAEFERSIIQERVKAGLAKAKAKGKKLGRPKTLIDEAKVLELRKQGLTIVQVSEKLGLSQSVVGRVCLDK